MDVASNLLRRAPAEPLAPEAPRGQSSVRTVIFRDPPGSDEEAARLRLEIARILVRAPALPVELAVFDLTLLNVIARRRGIDLVIGKTSPMARIRIEDVAAGNRGIQALRTPGTAHPVVRVTIEETHASAERVRPELEVMASRIQQAVTPEKWAAAREAALALLRLPTEVPLEFLRQMVPGTEAAQGLVRTGFQCNQDCGICWQDRNWGSYDAAQILIWIEDLYLAGAQSLIISGGEPTLDSELPKYVRLARALGYAAVTLETNAIQFARPGLAERLRDAGITGCFVSLHSSKAAVSDAITRAPGTFAKTLKGIQALLDAGVAVSLNCVLTNEGLDHLSSFPDFLHQTFGRHPNLHGLMLSAPTDSFDQSLNASIVPDPVKMRRVLRPTIDRAFELGLTVRGLDGPCGPPLCAFGADPRITSLRPVPEEVDFRVHLPACDGCAVRHACFGVRSVQAELYGDACVEPLHSISKAVLTSR